ncbi:hypothetical protein ACTXJJ_02295 [Corynebacterium casei]
MKKFKKFAAVASATALMGAGAMTAPTAFAQEEGSAESVTQSSEGENAEGEGDVSSEAEQSSEELSSNLEKSADQLSSDVGSSEEDENSEGSTEGLSSDVSSSTGETEEGEGSSENEQFLFGAGILAAIAGGIAAFLPQIQQYLPQA